MDFLTIKRKATNFFSASKKGGGVKARQTKAEGEKHANHINLNDNKQKSPFAKSLCSSEEHIGHSELSHLQYGLW